ncbi:MAG: 5-methylcytosine-specific restriction endonuclease system specificity protein McrC, partial [Thermoguttaceae bacterium]|nr:5-methylcytosine-specific restriction endonuclease system specificity protein McrC [Thermoguttaceae bacterium]
MIPVKNIYHMLAYAFDALDRPEFKDVEPEEFQNAADLLAEILVRSIDDRARRGLAREYVDQEKALTAPRGKIDVVSAMESVAAKRRTIRCQFDEYSENAWTNRVLKTALQRLLTADVQPDRKKALRRVLAFFLNVEPIPPREIDWNRPLRRQDAGLRRLVNIARLVIENLVQSQIAGNMRLATFDEQTMWKLYEQFIFKYFAREHNALDVKRQQIIQWQIDANFSSADGLPKMRPDVILKNGARTL